MVIPAIAKRRAVREFNADPVSDEDIQTLLAAGEFAPTAMGTQAVDFIVIRDPDMRKRLADVLDQVTAQEFVRTAPVVIVPVSDTTRSSWPIQDLSVASENIFIQAASMGIATVWKHVHPPIIDAVKEVLGIPATGALTNVIPVGYPKSPVAEHKDSDFQPERVHYNRW